MSSRSTLSHNETALRYVKIYTIIASNPSIKYATTTLQEKLAQEGYDISLRTLQRDLRDKITRIFPVTCYTEEKPYRWGLIKNGKTDLKIIDMPTALSLNLAQKHLKTLLPHTILEQLKSRFEIAENYLQQQTNNRIINNWQQRVYAMPNGKALLPADICPQTWQNISEALLHKKQLKITYSNASKQASLSNWHIHPQGLVSRHSTSYLIVTINDYSDLKILALHRIQTSQLLEQPCTQCSEAQLHTYIHSGELGWGSGEGNVKLIADISDYTATVLKETPLSKDQQIQPSNRPRWHQLSASVPKNQETLWWIYSLNQHIRVHEPKEWVEEITQTLKALQKNYQ